MKEKLGREYLHVPLYVWLAGAGAFIVTVLYFMKSRGKATAGTAANATLPSSLPPIQNIYNTTLPGSGSTSPPPSTLPAGMMPDNTTLGFKLAPGFKWIYQTGATLKDIANSVNSQYGTNYSPNDISNYNPDLSVGQRTYRVAVPTGGSGGGLPVYSPGAAPRGTALNPGHPGWAFLPQSTAIGLAQPPAMNSNIIADSAQQGPSVMPGISVMQPTPMYTNG